jgi:predicted PurR-regulated permease PerM
VFFWLTERSRLQRYALAFFPEDRRAGLRDAWNEVETRLGLWVRGQLILMASIGAMTGIAYTLLGLPAALLLALFAAIAEVIPILGPFIGAIPALLIATSVSPQTALLTLVVYVVLQVIEGNILVPAVMRNAIGLSPFLVLVSLLAGGAAGGILGAAVAVPLMAAIEAILERLQARDVPVPIDVTSDTPSTDEREELKRPPAAPTRSRKRRPSAS